MGRLYRGCFLLLLGVSLASCSTGYLNVKKMRIDSDSLASTFARSPDPQKFCPPSGQKLVVEWFLPKHCTPEAMHVKLDVVYKDLTQESFEYPISSRLGYIDYALMGEEFCEKRGILTYKVAIIDEEGKVLKSYANRMWFLPHKMQKAPCFDSLRDKHRKKKCEDCDDVWIEGRLDPAREL